MADFRRDADNMENQVNVWLYGDDIVATSNRSLTSDLESLLICRVKSLPIEVCTDKEVLQETGQIDFLGVKMETEKPKE